jgi:hypothetical protein
MDFDIREEVAAPVVEAVAPVAPMAPVAPAAPVSSRAECTRDTRGEAPCAVKDCENCN